MQICRAPTGTHEHKIKKWYTLLPRPLFAVLWHLWEDIGMGLRSYLWNSLHTINLSLSFNSIRAKLVDIFWDSRFNSENYYLILMSLSQLLLTTEIIFTKSSINDIINVCTNFSEFFQYIIIWSEVSKKILASLNTWRHCVFYVAPVASVFGALQIRSAQDHNIIMNSLPRR